MSWCALARRRCHGRSSDSLTGVTIDQWRPTGQRWMRQGPSRADFTDTPGIQIVE
jgi:hypothetical protein